MAWSLDQLFVDMKSETCSSLFCKLEYDFNGKSMMNSLWILTSWEGSQWVPLSSRICVYCPVKPLLSHSRILRVSVNLYFRFFFNLAVSRYPVCCFYALSSKSCLMDAHMDFGESSISSDKICSLLSVFHTGFPVGFFKVHEWLNPWQSCNPIASENDPKNCQWFQMLKVWAFSIWQLSTTIRILMFRIPWLIYSGKNFFLHNEAPTFIVSAFSCIPVFMTWRSRCNKNSKWKFF